MKAKPLSSALSIILLTFGAGLLTIILLASNQISTKLESNAKNIDLVVGAKGSPLQLILSNVYYMDFPTGNIPLSAARDLSANPFVKLAVPLAQGDNYKGFRIVGTNSNFIRLQQIKNGTGSFWHNDFEVSLGANVAKAENLKIGDLFYGAHGLAGEGDTHRSHQYKVVGILAKKGGVTDNLILTNISSIWKMHDDHDHQDLADGQHKLQGQDNDNDHNHDEKEVTALLIQYRSPMSVVMFPRMVNEMNNLQAASPAMESARLFTLIGIGVDTLQWLGISIICIASLSLFFNLFNALKDQKYDLAVMRTLGASPLRIFMIVFLEGIMITILGTATGMVAGHLALSVIGGVQDSQQVAQLTGTILMTEELYILAEALSVGTIAALIPSVQALKTDISEVLANK